MKLQGRSLSQGMKGEDVKLLHHELQQLKFTIPDNELSDSHFGDGTRNVVLQFQNKNRLRGTGEVDDATAKAINAHVDAQTSNPEPAAFVVRGRIVRVDGTPVAGAQVQAFDKDMRSEQPLGQPAVTDEHGAYEIAYRASEFARAEKLTADLIVRIAGQANMPTVSSPIIFNAAPTEVVNLSLDGDARQPSEYEIMLAEITKLLDGVLLTDIVENSEHQDISFLAGETGFEPQRIALLSRAAQLERDAQLPGAADSVQPVLSRQPRPTLHVAAVIFYGLLRQGLPDQLSALLSETSDALRHALQQSAQHNIIPSLSSSQLDQALNQLQVLKATSLLKPAADGQPPQFLNLLQTTNLSADRQLRVATLQIQHDGAEDGFWSALQDSGEFNADEIRTVRFTAQLATLTSGYLPLVRELQRVGSTNGGPATNGLPAGEELRSFAAFDITDWKKVLQRPQADGQPVGAPPTTPGTTTDEKIDNYAASLYHYIESALPTAVIANRLKKDDGATPLKSVHDDLNRFFANNPGFKFEITPIDLYLSTGTDQKLASVVDRNATVSALKKMQRVFNVTPRYAEIKTLLAGELDSAFAIVNVGQRRFVEKYGEALGGPSKAADAYQRAKRIHAKAVATYMNHARPINSPDVYAISGDPPRSAFSTDNNKRGITPDLATMFGPLGLCACSQCLSLYSPAAYFVDILKYLNDGPTKDGLTPLEALLKRRPDLEHVELTCENTNTQLPYVDLVNELLEAEISPRVIPVGEGINIAAVLADLAAGNLPATFRSAIAAEGYQLSDQVAVRADTQAGVENKNQWIVLDTSWAFTIRHLGQGEGFRVFAWPQTSWTSDELRANAEHVNGVAYNALRAAVYPWSLPLDLPWETVRAYLGALGIKRSELMESLFVGNPEAVLSNLDIALEYLGITSAEADILTGVTTGGPTTTTGNGGPWDFWGLRQAASVNDHSDPQAPPLQGDWDEVLQRVSILLQQSGLSYRELLELFGTHFINPEVGGVRTFGITSIDPDDPATCLPSKLQIELLDSNISRLDGKQKFVQLWARLHPFVRLWRKLGWTIRDLDKAFTAFNPRRNNQPGITNAFLVSLSHVQRLSLALSVSPLTTLAWWSLIDTTAYIDHLADGEPVVPSLYSTLFNNNAMPGQSLSRDPQNLTGKISDNSAAISAGLGISVQDLTLLRNDAAVVPFVPDPADATKSIPDDTLTLDNLSRLYRHASLASALKLSARSYLSTLNLVNTIPFATTQVTVKFVTTVAEIAASGHTIEELDYLLRHQFPVPSDAAVKERAIDAALDAMRAELRKIALENTFVESTDSATATSDQKGDLTKTKLALLNWSPLLIDQVISVLNNSFTYQTNLAALPANLVIPDSFRNILGYDEASQLLSFYGTMTTQQQTQLTALPNADTNFISAVNRLFDGPVAFVARYLRSFSVPVSAAGPLTLPANIKFPDSFRSRLYFDHTIQKLTFIGVMTEPELAALQKLAPADGTYQTALTTLFTSPAQRTLAAQDTFLTSGAGSDAAAMFADRTTTPEARFLLLLRKLLPFLRETLSRNVVKQQLAQQLNLTTETVNALVSDFVKSPDDANKKAIAEFLAPEFSAANENIASTSDAFPRQFKTLLLLQKAAAVILKFNVTRDELQFLFESGPGAVWLDLNTLPLTPSAVGNRFDGWLRLSRLFALRNQLPHGDDLLTSLLLDSRKPNAQIDSLLTKLSAGTQWEEQDVKVLASSFTLTTASFADASGIARVYAAMSLIKRLGSSATQALSWSTSSVTEANARDIESVVKGRYDLTAWSEKSKALRDPLRERQRSALVDYLVTTRGFSDANELYDRLLIDVEMSPCMMTTRIKQAISSVQLFVQRSLMNLEADVFLSHDDAKQWTQWRKQYRVWEANRKVLLYPENWIEPELRDDKSSFFKDLESELLQNDLTAAAAEDALFHYLEKLDQVARLEVAGIYQQIENSEITLHVFGRTRAYPHLYFYRWLKDGVWSPWQKVDVDIEGDHLLPVVWNRRIYLFWPTFTEKTDQQTKEQRLANEDPTKWWEIRFAWSEYKNNKWSPKRISKDPPLLYKKHPSPTVPQDPANFSFKTRIQPSAVGEQLSIECYGTKTEEVPPLPPVASSPAVTTNQELLVTFLKHGSGYKVKVDFKIDNDAPRSSERAKLKVQLRRKNGSLQEEMSVNQDGEASSGTEVAEELDCYLVSTAYASFSVSNKWEFIGLPGGLGITVDLVPWSPPSATTDTPPPPPPIKKLMQGLGEFTLDDGNGNLTAVPVGQVYNSLTPPALLTVNGTKIENQSLVENFNGTDALGSSGVLKSTPGTAFRLLMPHQGYAGTNFSFPFFFEDELRSYFVTYIPPTSQSTQKVHFATFFHPTALKFTKALNQLGIDGLLTLANQRLQDTPLAFAQYLPSAIVDADFPRENVDFSQTGAYSIYNWELFFHAPLLIATQLSGNQRFEEAQRWFHYIFDPTSTDSPDKPANPGPERFWRVKPFYDKAGKGIPTLSDLLQDQAELDAEVAIWQENPFKPHAIARLRLAAYMKTVVMKYIDNLIAWGDQLFSRDTIESINEATQLYILAARVLGKRPEETPARAKPKTQTYRTLDDKQALDALSNAVVEIESFMPPSVAPAASALSPDGLVMPFFCLASNDKLLGYWDTVADRLFKIRHCLNIEGIARSLPIFDPPIDPALLVRAAAAGIDLGSALSDTNAPVPPYRFSQVFQKASELCGDVKALGASLLSALEKRDAETLSLLRAGHESQVLKAVRDVKGQQVTEATNTLAGLTKYQDVVTARVTYYTSRAFINVFEGLYLGLANASLGPIGAQIGAELVAAILNLIPNTKGGAPTTIGLTYGGANIASAVQSFGSAAGATASLLGTTASLASAMGGYQRRQDDWQHQADLATKELEQVKKQIAAAEIRLAIADRELQNHDLQMDQAREVEDFMRSKFTDEELYSWMIGELSRIHFQAYQVAYDLAKRAERAYRHELGLRDSDFIQFGYWDSLRKGLLCGEKLHHDLRRMDAAFMSQNRREYEITKHISLLSLDPLSLIRLREEQECLINLPEALFDMDYPGHYLRRIKSIGLTIPCVTGPYAGVNCTLTQIKSSVRHTSTLLANKYPRQGDDPRFVDSFGAVESIVTSGGQDDSGLFETNLRDERFLPFEGTGAISTWRLELPKEFPAFDYNTISDVVLHLRYSARTGGETLKTAASNTLKTIVADSTRGSMARLFSIKHEFPTEWHRFLNPTAPAEGADIKYNLTLQLTRDRFPFVLRGKNISLKSMKLFLKVKDGFDYGDDHPFATHPDDDQNSSATSFLITGSPIEGLPFRQMAAGGAIPVSFFQQVREADLPSTAPSNKTWWQTVKINNTDRPRLKPGAIDDLLILCEYSAT